MEERFIHEFPLVFNEKDFSVLGKRLNAARQLYNACLGECKKKIKLIRESKKWQKAYSLYKSKKKEQIKQSKKLFREIKKENNYSEYQLHKFAKEISKPCFINSHLDSFSIQKVATRAYDASEKYYYSKRGKPRYKSIHQYTSIEGKSNKSGIRFSDGNIIWNVKKGKKLKLKIRYDLKDKHGVQAHALSHDIKYVRLVKRQIKTKSFWYAQLILSGNPKQKEKNKIGLGNVGLDIGPSTIAIVSEKRAVLTSFCEGLENQHNKIKKINRKMDRSKRATNPDNYNKDKTLKSQLKKWEYSNRYKQLKAQASYMHYKMSKTRDKMHGELINQILSYGNIIKTEKLSYKAFQKNFGKSVGFRAPGKFIEKLCRKAESANGRVIEFSTYKTKLSQMCHCGKQVKKKLSQRWHECECGVCAQRDLFSAYLALFVDNEKLNTSQAKNAWTVAETLLERAVLSLKQRASSQDFPASFGICSKNSKRQSSSHVKVKSNHAKVVDVVE